MIEYTYEDLLVLNDMVCYGYVFQEDEVGYFYKNGYYRLFNPCKIKKYSINEIANRFIEHLSPSYYTKSNVGDICHEVFKKKIVRLFYEAPLEEMPLFINIENNLSLIAKW